MNVNETILKNGINIVDLVVNTKLLESKSEVRRAIKNKGIKINNSTVTDEKLIISKTDFENNDYLKLSHGKKKHIIVKIS